jgi:hypothetical protein
VAEESHLLALKLSTPIPGGGSPEAYAVAAERAILAPMRQGTPQRDRGDDLAGVDGEVVPELSLAASS